MYVFFGLETNGEKKNHFFSFFKKNLYFPLEQQKREIEGHNDEILSTLHGEV